jgi:hypothetical protein
MDMSVPATWEDLPDEVLLRIGQLLDDAPSLLRLGQVNTHCRYQPRIKIRVSTLQGMLT